jgi:hypothetical protein
MVPKRSIKKLSGGGGGGGGRDEEEELFVGAQVEAKFKGSSKHYRGTIMKVNRDGTYYIKFDDGDKDLEVPRRNIKAGGGSKSPSKSLRDDDEDDGDMIREGDMVKARCKGSSKHYPGKIECENADGTFHVKFDDGDVDRAVPKQHVKEAVGGK